MSRVEDYAADVRRNFLAGLPHSSPAEAVAAGSRTLREWCQALDRAREDAGIGSEKLPGAFSRWKSTAWSLRKSPKCLFMKGLTTVNSAL